MLGERGTLAQRLAGNRFGRPDLPVRVRIAGAHHRAAIFENLHVADPGIRRESRVLFNPGFDDMPNVRRVHARQREIVPRRKTDDAADAAFRRRREKPVRSRRLAGRHSRHQRRVVIVEDERR